METTVLKRYLRWLQTFVPWAAPLKFAVYNLLARWFGAHIEPEFHILRHLTGIKLAVDVGGNWGQSITALRRLCPDAHVVSFEPNPALAHRLQSSFAHDHQVVVHNLALSSSSGEVTLHVPVYRGFVFDGIASLDRAAAEGWINPERIAFFDPAKLAVRSHQVAMQPLDRVGLVADFIKIDVQGHELEVLKGAAETLARRPVVVLESVTLEIVRYLAQFGLKPYHFVGGRLVIMHAAINTIFLSDDHLAQSRLVVSRGA